MTSFSLLSGCGSGGTSTTAPQSGCPTGTALIEVGDGFARIHCGCQEAAFTTSSASNPLTCTVASGTTVFFDYSAATLQHQIVASGTPDFAPSARWEPESSFKAHPVQFTTSGTYGFKDLFHPATTGQIVVP